MSQFECPQIESTIANTTCFVSFENSPENTSILHKKGINMINSVRAPSKHGKSSGDVTQPLQ